MNRIKLQSAIRALKAAFLTKKFNAEVATSFQLSRIVDVVYGTSRRSFHRRVNIYARRAVKVPLLWPASGSGNTLLFERQY